MTREEAKQLFREDKDAYGKPKAIMTKIDKIYDEFESELIRQLVKERTRAVDLCYEFKNKYDKMAREYALAGGMKLTNERLADSARIIGNTISGSNALSATLGETMVDRIRKELK